MGVSFIPLRAGSMAGPAHERSDAARNRARLLGAARELIEECGAAGLTMDRLAERAGVGKGTVFRRFGSRAGLMMTLLSDAEADFQARFMFGPPPAGARGPGPGQAGRFRLRRASPTYWNTGTWPAPRTSPPTTGSTSRQPSFGTAISRSCCGDEGMEADPRLMAMALSSTLDPERLLHAVHVQGISPERLAASWRELVTRVVRGA